MSNSVFYCKYAIVVNLKMCSVKGIVEVLESLTIAFCYHNFCFVFMLIVIYLCLFCLSISIYIVT